jgi:hypothetical protein
MFLKVQLTQSLDKTKSDSIKDMTKERKISSQMFNGEKNNKAKDNLM